MRSGGRSGAKRRDFECVALLLQGGGALGAYQGGVYEALAEAQLHPDWVAGISIGAINSAIIAGNPPGERVAKLREFWEGITASPGWAWSDAASRFVKGEAARRFINQASAAAVILAGVPGFFTPRMPAPWLFPSGSIEATSWYETSKLRATLERVVDFERINRRDMRMSLGSVNIRTGNFVYFDTESHVIRPEHVLASGALPPGLPAIEIEGEHYWDGGLVSNTPLQWVLLQGPRWFAADLRAGRVLPRGCDGEGGLDWSRLPDAPAPRPCSRCRTPGLGGRFGCAHSFRPYPRPWQGRSRLSSLTCTPSNRRRRPCASRTRLRS
jgi:NTE family protein